MSMVAVVPKLLVGATKRGAMTPARKRRIHAARDGLCAWCKKPVPILGEGVVYDHHIPLAIGGSDDDDNIRPLHAAPCDKIKTALDKKTIAKVLRLRARLEGQRRKRQAIVSRGFEKPAMKRKWPSRSFERKPL